MRPKTGNNTVAGTPAKPRPIRPKVDRECGRGGVDLLNFEDSSPNLDLPEAGYEFELTKVEVGVDPGHNPIPESVRKAVIIDKCRGEMTRVVALKYQLHEDSVRRIYHDFMVQADQVRAIADQGPEGFRSSIRRKAVVAIENGLDCDRDPYRQARVGLDVMKGIGEFRPDNLGASVTINNMVASLPSDWKNRYLSATPPINQIGEGGDHSASQD